MSVLHNPNKMFQRDYNHREKNRMDSRFRGNDTQKDEKRQKRHDNIGGSIAQHGIRHNTGILDESVNCQRSFQS